VKGDTKEVFCSKILVPYDGSELAQKSLEKAILIANIDTSISLEIMHVVTAPMPHTVLEDQNAFEDILYEEGKNIIAKAESALATLQNDHQCYLLEGSPAHIILNHAKEHNCDLIIMGSRGLTGIKEFLGSVSHMVVQHSHVPVLIIK